MTTKRTTDKTEYFYFTIENWTREYGFEVKRHKWEFSPYHYAENDVIKVFGAIRNKTKRKFKFGEAHILPSFISREEVKEDGANRIGNVWSANDTLFCSAFIPSDAYFSLPACFVSGMFEVMEWRVNSLRYRKGQIDSIKLNCDFSELGDD